MIILVNSLNEKNLNRKNIIYSKEIICPECGEKSIIDINDYIIALYGCNNKHLIKNISINEYIKTQYIDQSLIKCNKCNNNKSESYNNEFYKCITCKMFLCPLCRNTHDKAHNEIKYELIKYICDIHNCRYNSYCEICKSNICMECEQQH